MKNEMKPGGVVWGEIRIALDSTCGKTVKGFQADFWIWLEE